MNQLTEQSNDAVSSPKIDRPKTLASFGYYNRNSSAAKQSSDSKREKAKVNSESKPNIVLHSNEFMNSKPLLISNYLVQIRSPLKYKLSPDVKVPKAEKLYAAKVNEKLTSSDEKIYMKSGAIHK